ncbi:hypothetical protein T07_13044 [Trichinella nelsoni]|uniref:Uncharacterized protein n=1 Tax=Trichinella nelsoni TaxID=6336 RepID=A0A0V0REN6_9BILA|nr:hypothetical protein T07_13044 [Trichinella nelsoni]
MLSPLASKLYNVGFARKCRREDETKEHAQSDGGRTGADQEADPPAPPCGSLQWGPVRELSPSVYRGAYYCPPSSFSSRDGLCRLDGKAGRVFLRQQALERCRALHKPNRMTQN